MTVAEGRANYAARGKGKASPPSGAMETGALMHKANHGDAEAKAELRRRLPPAPPKPTYDPDGVDVTPHT